MPSTVGYYPPPPQAWAPQPVWDPQQGAWVAAPPSWAPSEPGWPQPGPWQLGPWQPGPWQPGPWQPPNAPWQTGPWQAGPWQGPWQRVNGSGSPWQPGPWQPGYGWPGTDPRVQQDVQARARRNRIVAIGLVIVVVVAGAIGLAALANRSNNTLSSADLQSAGTIVFQDDFHDPSSGWTTGQSSTGTTYAYGASGYQISRATTTPLEIHVYSPFAKGLTGLSVTATESISTDSGDGSIGVDCRRLSGDQRVQYEFVLDTSGDWAVELRTGAVSISNIPTDLRIGAIPTGAGTTPVTITGTCRTAADGLTTELVLTIDGTLVVDFTDSETLPDTGWTGGVDAGFWPPQGTVTVTDFVERDVSNP